MSRLQIDLEPYTPRHVERWPDRLRYLALVRRRQRAARLGAAPAVTLIVVGLLAAVPHWIPELGLGRLLPEFFGLFGTAVARPVFTGGAAPAGGAPDAGAAPTVAFFAALVLGWATRQGGLARVAALPAAVALVVASVMVGLVAAREPLASVASLLCALACAGIGVAVAVIAVRGWLRRGVHPYARRTPGLRTWRNRWLIAYVFVLPVPFMVGRALIGGDWRDRGAEIIDSGSTAMLDTLLTSATPLAWLVGVTVGLAVWGGLRFVPPVGELPAAPSRDQFLARGTSGHENAAPLGTVKPRLLAPSIVVLLLVVLGAALVAPAAVGAAGDTVDATASRVPESPGAYCPTFLLPGSQPQRGLVPGTHCRGLEVYEGLVKTGSLDLDVAFDGAAGSSTPEGDLISADSVSGVYDPVLVVAGGLDWSGLDVVMGISFADAAVVWQFQCPDAEPFAIRLAGTGLDDLSAGRGTYPGEGESVVIGCANSVHRLDPQTGEAR